jgi:hypothetical protein
MSLVEKYWHNPRAKRNSAVHMQPLIDARVRNRQELGLQPLHNVTAPMQLPEAVPRHIVLVASSWVMVRHSAKLCC